MQPRPSTPIVRDESGIGDMEQRHKGRNSSLLVFLFDILDAFVADIPFVNG